MHIDMRGQLRSKVQFLGSLADERTRYLHYDLADNVITVEGDVAIVTGRFLNEQISADGTIITKSGRHVRIFVRRGVTWSNIVHQGTAIIS